MKPRSALTALFVAGTAMAAAGCGCPRQLDGLRKELDELYAAKLQAVSASQSVAVTEAKLAAVAAHAQQGAAECKEMAPAFYRVAAVAAWQADGAGAALMNPISTQGIAACAALPAKDNTAPRDCTLIRIAGPMALQDELTAKQLAVRKQAEQSSNGKLPASDLPQLRQLLEGYVAASTQLAAVRQGARGLDSPQTLLEQTDRQRLIIYCNAVETFGLMGRIEGMTFAQLAGERPPLDAIKASLQDDAIDISGPDTCRVSPTQDAAFLTAP